MRNGTGSYSPPAEFNPVSNGTVIDAGAWNATIADIASALTGSLPRDGQAPMSGPLKLADGTAGAPGIAWNSDATTGFFRPVTNSIALTAGGVEQARWIAGNLLLGTPTNTGERLQVIGTSRLAGNVTITTGGLNVVGGLSVNGAITTTVGAFTLRDDVSGGMLVLSNKVVSGVTHTFGQIVFDSYRDVASPSYVASIWAEGTSPIGNIGSLVFGTTSNGNSAMPTERLRIGPTGVVTIGGATTIGGELRVGNALIAGAYAGPGVASGDIIARRSATAGVLYFGDNNANNLYFDGSTYIFNGSKPVYVTSPNWSSAVTIGGSNGGILGTNSAGNLHLDAAGGTDGYVYLSYFSGNGVKFGNGASGIAASVSKTGVLTAAGLVGPLTGTASNATLLDGVSSSEYMLNRGIVYTTGATPTQDSATLNGFYRVERGGYSSTTLSFNALGSAGPVQLDAFFQGNLRFRNKTDSSTWTAWKEVMTDANIGNYAAARTGGNASGTWPINITGNAGQVDWGGVYNKPVRDNWVGRDSLGVVVGQLAWKNYGNNHTIFDASAGTNPGGGGINSTNPDSAWSASFPTLMGWNGSSTYGVRVDSARYADYVKNSSGVNMTLNYNGQGGQPTWLWGTNDGVNNYVWNPSNFSVNYANSAGSSGSVPWSGVSGRPTDLSFFNNGPGYVTLGTADGRYFSNITINDTYLGYGGSGYTLANVTLVDNGGTLTMNRTWQAYA